MSEIYSLKDSIEAAAAVARHEAAALERLDGVIRSAAFEKALRLCLEVEGALYVIGMGKSGLVGRKMAATLTSTGSPAIYIHAGDAVHGDLGAIRPGDMAILISKSGETRETLRIIPFLKSQGNPVIAITNDGRSSLAAQADAVLPMMADSEGCPLNLAPMTSTTATMALGDALAAALIVAKRFKGEDFARFHPGGKLGWMLTAKVSDMIDGSKNPVLGEAATLREAVVRLVETRLGAVSVVDGGGKLAGIITDGDMKRIMISGDNGPLDRPVAEFMAADPATIRRDASAAEAVELMERRESQISVLPVVDGDGRPVGMLRLHDVIRRYL
ncbi:MAG: KpsF/GutQ family sugar-phosphate isomerase [Candidatus Nitrospinota bacterium M3_3B_026]